MAIAAPSLPFRRHRLALRLLAAAVLAGTGLALATTVAELQKAVTLLAATTIGALSIAVFVQGLMSRRVSRHLEQMARHARGLNLEQLNEPLVLARRPGIRPDELDDVTTALNDITRSLADELERRAAINADRAQAYERNRTLLQAIIDNSAAVIWVKALDGRYLLVNRHCAERHHRPAEDFVGKTDYDLFPKELADPLRRFDLRVIDAGVPMQEEEQIPLDDGVHTVLSAKAPLFNDRG
ncbi:MAG TPA: PAS domain-containing protein, partial [Albitalea sp.]|nr:PAS domain-containing protein [Albitalea sp.]